MEKDVERLGGLARALEDDEGSMDGPSFGTAVGNDYGEEDGEAGDGGRVDVGRRLPAEFRDEVTYLRHIGMSRKGKPYIFVGSWKEKTTFSP